LRKYVHIKKIVTMGQKQHNFYVVKKAETLKNETEILTIYSARIAYNGRRIRLQMGFSPKELCSIVDCDIGTIKRIETGLNRHKVVEPRLITLVRIAEACKVSVIEFFKPIPTI